MEGRTQRQEPRRALAEHVQQGPGLSGGEMEEAYVTVVGAFEASGRLDVAEYTSSGNEIEEVIVVEVGAGYDHCLSLPRCTRSQTSGPARRGVPRVDGERIVAGV